MTEERWTTRALNGAYRAGEAAHRAYPMDYAIEGLMPATGATIWFGAGSTGKTQLLLWLAAHIAATGSRAPQHWLDAAINIRGQILVLTAEDLREHLMQRIGSIAKHMIAESGGDPKEAVDLCERIHVMAFLSMTPAEFSEPNPCLFERAEGTWRPTKVLEEVEKFLDLWNERMAAEGRPEDRFVGVILDSAVSMAGFELTDSGATTNFLFHLNRMSRRQNLFWAVIGHTPKDAAKKADDEAIERLRGSAMWSTTPRTVIEVRLAGPSEDLETVRAACPGLDDRDVVIVEVAKANSEGADRRPRALMRRRDGAYEDITRTFPEIFADRSRRTTRSRTTAHTLEVRRAVVNLLRLVTEDQAGAVVNRETLQAEFVKAKKVNPVLAHLTDEVDGKAAKRKGTLAHEIALMSKDGLIRTNRGDIRIVDLDSSSEALLTAAE